MVLNMLLTPLSAFSLQCFWSTSSPVKPSEVLCCWSDCVTPGKPSCSAGWVEATKTWCPPPRWLPQDAQLVRDLYYMVNLLHLTDCAFHVLAAAVRKIQADTDLHHWQQCSLQSQKRPGKLSLSSSGVILSWWTWFTCVPTTSCVQGSTWTLIDLPGHDSLRSQYLEKFKSAARWEQDSLSE